MLKKKTKKLFLIIFFFINTQFSLAENTSQIPNEIDINLSWKSLKRYIFYIDQLKKSFITDPIPNEYKKKFSAKVFYKNKENTIEILPASARITGDVLDHIDTNKNLSSFKIELERGNINYITKFRLLTDNKSHNDEIFWSILIRELGFPSSTRGLVSSKINGLETKKYFFEETYAKEFIERIGLRNSPVIEMDDREKFYIQSKKKKCYFFSLSGYQSDPECIKKFDELIKKIDIYKVENKSFIQNSLTAQIAYNAIISRNKLNIFNEIMDGKYDDNENVEFNKSIQDIKKKISENKTYRNYNTFSKIHQLYGRHALNNYNIKFIFDPIFEELLPVNWDSNVILTNKCIDNKKNYNENFSKNNLLKKKLNKINNQFLKITKTNVTNEMKCLVSLFLDGDKFKYKNSSKLLNFFDKKDKQIIDSLLIHKTKNKFPIVKIEENFKDGKICYSVSNCKKIDFDEIKNVLGGDYVIKDEKDEYIFPYLYLGTKSYKNKKSKIANKNINSKMFLEVKKNSTYYLNFNKKKKIEELNIVLHDPKTSKLVIHNSNLKNLKINVITKNIDYSFVDINQIRHDELLLTGCLTIIDSKLDNLEINSNNANCEDAINFIRSEGVIKNINVKNSKFDAIDADSSNIVFEKVKVENALNDCIDFSFGNYYLKDVEVNNCGDKGLSVGEKSSVNILNFNSSNTNLPFVSKDSSLLALNHFKSDLAEDFTCGKAYNKKQEFGGAKIILNKNIYCKVNVDEFSKLNLLF